MVSNSTITKRIFLSREESQFLDRSALRYGYTRAGYLRTCLNDVSTRDRLVVFPFTTKRSIAAYFELEAPVWEKASQDAQSLGFKVERHASGLNDYIRQRMLGGLTFNPPRVAGMKGRLNEFEKYDAVMGLPVRRGRPRNSDLDLEMHRGTMLQQLLSNAGEMGDFIEKLFVILFHAGVEPGDVEAVYDLARCILSTSMTHEAVGPMSEASDPRVIQGSRSYRRTEAWSPGGRVVIEPAPSGERRQDARMTLKKLRRMYGS